MSNQDNTEQIESYLSGEMKGDTLEQFKQRMQADQKLAAEVELHKNVDAAIFDEGAFNLQSLTDTLGEEFFTAPSMTEKPSRLKVYRRTWAIAATVLLLVVSGWVWWSLNGGGSQTGEALFASYYEAPTFSNTVRGDDPQADYYFQAVQAYKTNDLANAISLFEAHTEAAPNDIRAEFGLASALLQSQPPRLTEAASYFQVVIDHNESLLVDKSKWYLALIWLKQENRTAAQSLLQELSNSEDKQLAKQAQALLEDL